MGDSASKRVIAGLMKIDPQISQRKSGCIGKWYVVGCRHHHGCRKVRPC